MKNIVIITNMPTPYRNPVYELVNKDSSINLNLIYCTSRESNRKWEVKTGKFKEHYLKSNYLVKKDGFNFVHNNIDVFKYLKSIKPDVIITCGFNPTHLYAFFYSLSKGITHISMTDCWEHSESSLSFIHRSIRRIVFKYTDKWVVPGTLGAAHLNKNYNVALDEIIQVPLCADIEENVLISKISTQRKIDFIFVGNFEARKNPILFIEACNILQQNIALKVAITMVGDGALLADCKSLAKKYKLNINFTGNVESQQVIDLLSMSKYMAFPTSLDAWGLVVNEALSVGTPVISSIFAASTADLVINEGNGYVINKLDAQEIGGLMLQAYHLSDEDWAVFSESAKIISKDFSYKIAAKKLINEVFL